jgi:hypothetical protein
VLWCVDWTLTIGTWGGGQERFEGVAPDAPLADLWERIEDRTGTPRALVRMMVGGHMVTAAHAAAPAGVTVRAAGFQDGGRYSMLLADLGTAGRGEGANGTGEGGGGVERRAPR